MKLSDFDSISEGQKYTNGKTVRTITKFKKDRDVYNCYISWSDNKNKSGKCYADTFLYWAKTRVD